MNDDGSRERASHASADADRPAAASRAAYPAFLAIPTRWMDNDAYGHVNNVTYYSYFDTVVNEHLVRAGGLDIARSPVIGVVVETACRFHKPLSFPDVVDAGLRVVAIGRSSARYEIAIFRQGDDDAAATGRFVHVWVDRETRRPVPVPERIRHALEALRVV
jgi:acyl-CoA thioester hydrolase